MRAKLIIIVLLLLSAKLFAGTEKNLHLVIPSPLNTDTIDHKLFDYAQNTPAEISQDISKLVAYLIQPAATKRDMAKLLSYWIIQNINYDTYGFTNNAYNQDGPEGTLRTKKGVCEDYSELFKAMCDKAGIKCYLVIGYAKGFNHPDGSKFADTNHAWNVICLDNNYYLMDLTWSSGYVDYVNGELTYSRQPDTTQFFVSPAKFVQKHLPTNPKWQLLDRPVAMSSFQKYLATPDMFKESSQYYNYRDSISTFDKLDENEQEIKEAQDSYNFYPVLSDFAFHYYNTAVSYSNAAVNAYNKSISEAAAAKQAELSSAISYLDKAIKLLSQINSYEDEQINALAMLKKCNANEEEMKAYLKSIR